VSHLHAYLETLAQATAQSQATTAAGEKVPLDAAIDRCIEWAKAAHDAGRKIMIIGNGGSAGIASHTAIDLSKNANLRTLAFNDSSALTCLGNDFGFEHVFAKQIEFHGNAGDLLIAISSSGRSANILNAVAAARARAIRVLTFSGFTADNPLRAAGDLNFYVPASEYGFVEMGHQALLHALLDLKIGWQPAAQ
jgi:D-sedoheptulose 7-phosphate isomerase